MIQQAWNDYEEAIKKAVKLYRFYSKMLKPGILAKPPKTLSYTQVWHKKEDIHYCEICGIV